MLDRGEPKPGKETIAARDALRGAIFSFSESRGVDARKVFEKGHSVGVKLMFDEHTREDIPRILNDFVQEQYPGRSLGIDEIEVGYKEQPLKFGALRMGETKGDSLIVIKVAHLYPRNPQEAEREKQRIPVGEEEATGMRATERISKLEADTDYEYFILPDKGLVLVNAICLTPHRTPTTYGITSYPLDEWVEFASEAGRTESAGERVQRIAGTMNKIVDPYGLGLGEDRKPEGMPPFGSGHVMSNILKPEVILAVASLIPDKPVKQRNVDDVIAQPRKQLTI